MPRVKRLLLALLFAAPSGAIFTVFLGPPGLLWAGGVYVAGLLLAGGISESWERLRSLLAY